MGRWELLTLSLAGLGSGLNAMYSSDPHMVANARDNFRVPVSRVLRYNYKTYDDVLKSAIRLRSGLSGPTALSGTCWSLVTVFILLSQFLTQRDVETSDKRRGEVGRSEVG